MKIRKDFGMHMVLQDNKITKIEIIEAIIYICESIIEDLLQKIDTDEIKSEIEKIRPILEIKINLTDYS